MNNTIKDVARCAGVSTTTVSHVLNGGPNRARYAPATVASVLQAAERLSYAPSRRAHNMRKGVNKVISIFSSMTSASESGYACMIFTGAALALREAGYALEIVNPSAEADLGRVLENTDGVIFSVDVDPKAARVVQDSGVPSVRLNLGLLEPENCVEPDDRTGTSQIGSHLVALGYERVFYVCRSKDAPSGHPSIQIREAALAESLPGVSFDVLTLDRRILAPVISDLCRRALPHTAFVGYGDSARQVLQRMFARAGLEVPDDVGVASCHTGLFGQTIDMDLPATGATYRVTELGAAGANMLLARIQNGGRSEPSVLVPEAFVEGKTTCRQHA